MRFEAYSDWLADAKVLFEGAYKLRTGLMIRLNEERLRPARLREMARFRHDAMRWEERIGERGTGEERTGERGQVECLLGRRRVTLWVTGPVASAIACAIGCAMSAKESVKDIDNLTRRV